VGVPVSDLKFERAAHPRSAGLFGAAPLRQSEQGVQHQRRQVLASHGPSLAIDAPAAEHFRMKGPRCYNLIFASREASIDGPACGNTAAHCKIPGSQGAEYLIRPYPLLRTQIILTEMNGRAVRLLDWIWIGTREFHIHSGNADA
jgi:hypothetical protein